MASPGCPWSPSCGTSDSVSLMGQRVGGKEREAPVHLRGGVNGHCRLLAWVERPCRSPGSGRGTYYRDQFQHITRSSSQALGDVSWHVACDTRSRTGSRTASVRQNNFISKDTSPNAEPVTPHTHVCLASDCVW